MAQRFLTGGILLAMLIVVMYFGGAVLGTAAMICICFAVYEEFNALKIAGHRPVSWPTWVGMAGCIPLTLLTDGKAIVPLLVGVCLITLCCVIFREDPRLDDAMFCLLPMFTIALPGMCIISLAMVQPKALQLTLLSLLFAAPVAGDTFAFLVGSRVGGPKLCPAVSPKKTISGAVAGLVGSMLIALVVGLVARTAVTDPAVLAHLPSYPALALIGLLTGAAGQLGDLLASMVKRHSGIKDFSNLFPGHGGMLDRLDSVLMSALVVYSFYLLGIM